MNIEAIRLQLDLKPGEFAAKLGVSMSHGADLRSGRRKPTLRHLARLEQMTGKKYVAQAVKRLTEA